MEAAGSTPRPGTLLGEHIAVATAPPAHLWQARLAPEAKPYPGRHRIHGTELVPVSVLLQTLSAAAAELDASTLCDIRFEHPIVVDQPRVIQVVADNRIRHCVIDVPRPTPPRTVGSGTSAPESRASGKAWQAMRDSGDHEMRDDDTVSAESLDSLQRAWGIEGQPFQWSIGSCRSAPGVCTPMSSCPRRRRSHCSTPPFTSPAWWTVPTRS